MGEITSESAASRVRPGQGDDGQHLVAAHRQRLIAGQSGMFGLDVQCSLGVIWQCVHFSITLLLWKFWN